MKILKKIIKFFKSKISKKIFEKDRILIVKDDKLVNLRLKGYLEEHADCHVDSTYTAIEAIKVLKAAKVSGATYKMAIIDYLMTPLSCEYISVLLKEIEPNIKTVLVCEKDDLLFNYFKHFAGTLITEYL